MQKIQKDKMVLKYGKPANALSPWEESMPIGNGVVGALVQGGVRYERIMLSDLRCTWQGGVGVLPDVSDKIKEARKLVDAKNQVMAGMALEKGFEVKKYEPKKVCPLPLVDFVVEEALNGKHISNYFRQINMENGEATVSFTDLGMKVDRSCFVSADDNVFYYEIVKVGNAPLDVVFKFVEHDKRYASFNGKLAPTFEEVNQETGASTLFFDEAYDGVHFGAVARIIADNKAVYSSVDGGIRVENAEKILVLVKTYSGKVCKKEWERVNSELIALKNPNYEKAFKAHYAEFSKKLGKCELVLSTEKDTTVENLIANISDDSVLIYEKLFNFGKYINACGIPDGCLPSFTTGPWSYQYVNNNALADTCCIMPALYDISATLGNVDKLKSVIDYFEKYADDLKKNACRVYKSKGYSVPSYIAFGTGVIGSTRAQDVSTTVGGAIIANLFYEYFQYTKDLKFLKNEALPFMCEVAKFYMNYFFVNSNGKVCSCPSYLPYGKSLYFENKSVGVYSSCPSDFVVVRSLLSNIISLSNNYSIALDDIVEYQKFLNMLPQPKTERGVLCEYSDDQNSAKSSGFLHFYPVYATKDITTQSSSTIFAPYLNTVVQKIDKALFAQNIISLGRLSGVSALLGQGNASISIVRYMIDNFMSSNLLFFNNDKNNLCAFVDGDNYFNIAGNELVLSSFINCLVMNSGKNISILASKPKNWTAGKISGVNTEKNCVVDVEWDDKKGTAIATFKATKSTVFNIRLFAGVKKVKNYTINLANPVIENVNLASGKSVVLEIKY